MSNDELPERWAETGFIEVFDVQGGTQPPKSTFVYEPTKGYVQLLQIRDFGERPVPTFIPDRNGLKKCVADDILIARYGASLGRILTGLEGAYNVAMAKVIIPKEINRGFAYYLLKSEAFQAPLRLVSRSAQNGFNKEDLAGFRIPIAPLAEQKRIADKLEAVLGRVDACRTRLDRVPALLKRFRQSVLAAATSGKLTEDFGGGNWTETSFAELYVSAKTGLDRGSADQANDRLYPYLKMNNITSDGRMHLLSTTRVDASAEEIIRYSLNSGDFLFNTRNSVELVGKTCVFNAVGIETPFLFNNNILRVRFKPGILPEYINAWFCSPEGRHHLNRLKSATTSVAAIYQSRLNELRLLVPPLPEQTEIVRRVEALFALADQIEARLTDARGQVERLTPATLAKAFRGELVPQDPKDEPASVMLERLRQQTASPAAKGKGTRGRRVARQAAAPSASSVAISEPVADEDSELPGLDAARPLTSETEPEASLTSTAQVRATAATPTVPKPKATPATVSEERINVEDLHKEDLMSLLREVLQKHGPCDRDTAIQQAAHALGYKRTGSVVTPILDNAIRTASRRRVLFNEAGELRVNRASIADMEAEDRPFMKEQFLAAISQGGRVWTDREDAARLFANWFGYRRTGHQIQDRVKSLINGLIREKALETDGNWIRRV